MYIGVRTLLVIIIIILLIAFCSDQQHAWADASLIRVRLSAPADTSPLQ